MCPDLNMLWNSHLELPVVKNLLQLGYYPNDEHLSHIIEYGDIEVVSLLVMNPKFVSNETTAIVAAKNTNHQIFLLITKYVKVPEIAYIIAGFNGYLVDKLLYLNFSLDLIKYLQSFNDNWTFNNIKSTIRKYCKKWSKLEKSILIVHMNYISGNLFNRKEVGKLDCEVFKYFDNEPNVIIWLLDNKYKPKILNINVELPRDLFIRLIKAGAYNDSLLLDYAIKNDDVEVFVYSKNEDYGDALKIAYASSSKNIIKYILSSMK